MVCPDHGEFTPIPYNHYFRGNGCKVCGDSKKHLSKDNFVARANKVFGNIYDYSKYVVGNDVTKVIIGCKLHGDFEQRRTSHLSGNGCPVCGKGVLRKSTEKFILESKDKFTNRYTYENVKYVNNRVKVKITCKKHGVFEVNPRTHLHSQGGGCPRCIESYGELRINNLLDKYNLTYIKEYKIPGYKYRYDFYLPDHKIYIEFHGKQHYEPVEIFGGWENFIKVSNNDHIKETLVKEYGGKYLEIPFTSIDKVEDILSLHLNL